MKHGTLVNIGTSSKVQSISNLYNPLDDFERTKEPRGKFMGGPIGHRLLFVRLKS